MQGLRTNYAGTVPGHHLNKHHWNTLTLDGELPPELPGELIEHSYALVAASLTRAARAALTAEVGNRE